jgi:hypothetical protein
LTPEERAAEKAYRKAASSERLREEKARKKREKAEKEAEVAAKRKEAEKALADLRAAERQQATRRAEQVGCLTLFFPTIESSDVLYDVLYALVCPQSLSLSTEHLGVNVRDADK